MNGFAQISVLGIEKSISAESQFALERASSCVTRILQNPSENIWECVSTVRRQTGFSREEAYTIKILNGKVKVEKKVEESK